jgi:hypothetical protein
MTGSDDDDAYGAALTSSTYPSRVVVDVGVIGAAGGDGKAAAAAAAARSRPKDAFEEEMELLAQRQQEDQEVRPTRLVPSLLSFMTRVCLSVCLSGCVVLWLGLSAQEGDVGASATERKNGATSLPGASSFAPI